MTEKTHDDHHGSHAGRPSSWIAVGIMVAGFIVGGVALCVGPSWIMFWAGVAIVVVGFIVGGAVHIFSDVVVDAPRVIPEIVDYSVFGGRTTKRRGGAAGETLDKPSATDPQTHPHG
ncbi:HGxxPAAW family protein [Actinomadura rugatobispora]|uniref:HGxxPAAW family protein n=1 Tax=Actinomadura rugatobispora TaxID=1994 RepID=A0ABW1AEJ9_9ACTN